MSCDNCANKCVRPIYGEDYEQHWAGMDYQGKKVLDIGADIGSTADFFLRKGASYVYAVEGNTGYYNQLLNYSYGQPIKPILLNINNSGMLERLIRDMPADIVKMDCERCERYLKDISNDVLKRVPEYIIEAHNPPILEMIVNKFNQIGYNLFQFMYGSLTMLIARSF